MFRARVPGDAVRMKYRLVRCQSNGVLKIVKLSSLVSRTSAGLGGSCGGGGNISKEFFFFTRMTQPTLSGGES